MGLVVSWVQLSARQAAPLASTALVPMPGLKTAQLMLTAAALKKTHALSVCDRCDCVACIAMLVNVSLGLVLAGLMSTACHHLQNYLPVHLRLSTSLLLCEHPAVSTSCCVQRQVREVLEGYLDDDQDMKDMNITAKEQHALQVRQSGLNLLGTNGQACGAFTVWAAAPLAVRLQQYIQQLRSLC